MRCKHCGYENDSGVYRCQKCGNSLLPSLPKEIYLRPVPHASAQAEKRFRQSLTIVVCIFAVLVLGTIASVIVYSADAFNNSTAAVQSDEQASESTTVIADFEDAETLEVEKGILKLPDSDITVGIPDYIKYTFSYEAVSATATYSFELGEGLSMDLVCSRTDYPFTKSEQEEYFMEEYDYDRIEGSDDQYFIMQSDEKQAQATIIDRLSSHNYQIIVYGTSWTSSDLTNKAKMVLNQKILEPSSMIQKEADAQ